MRPPGLLPEGLHHFVDGQATTTPCAGPCGRPLELLDAQPCAILICSTCRKDPVLFRQVRQTMFNHIHQHTIEEKKKNPFYPFLDFSEAWAYA